MATLAELAAFSGSPDEYQKLLADEITAGSITEEVADALYNAFSGNAEEVPTTIPSAEEVPTTVPNAAELSTAFSAFAPPVDVAGVEQFLRDIEPQPEPTFLEQLQREELAALTIAAQSNTPVPSMDVLRNRVIIGRDAPLRGLRDEELTALAEQGDEGAVEELKTRKILSEQSVFESLSNPETFIRTGAAAIKGVAQIPLVPQALAGLAASGFESVTGLDVGGDAILLDFDKKQQELERSLGISPAISPIESLAESLTGALVPGGVFSKLAGVGTDFLVDQTVRELTDDIGEQYETVFDRAGITNNNTPPVLGTLGAIGATLLGGALTAKAISTLSEAHLSRAGTKFRDVKSIDINAPEGLVTIEKASDLTKTIVVDEQQVLKDIIKRQGVPDFADIDTRIELDTHAASRTRVVEAVNTGKLSTASSVFNSPVAPRDLYNAYQSLDPSTRTNVARFINLKDLRDDIVLAIDKGEASNADLFAIDSQLQSIVKVVPQAAEFSKRYNSVNAALRNFAEGSLFSPEYKARLDITRPNYVELEFSKVDNDAPFFQRLFQAQTGEATPSVENVLYNRSTGGKYDINRRTDPFDMLIQSTEATLAATLKNNTKLAIVDAMLNSDVNQQLATTSQFLIREATDDDIVNNAERLIKVYRNGEPETYITSKLTAQLTRFDPYIAKHPALFVPKRLFEQSAVGPLSVTFAPVTLLRDALGGRVTAPQGLLAPNALDVAKAIPQQLWAKALGGISSHFQTSFLKGDLPLPEGLVSATAQKRFGDNVAQAYTQTLYHQANTAGGFDASVIKERIQIGQGALNEAKRTIQNSLESIQFPAALDPAVETAKISSKRILNMLEGFKGIFTAIQDAPRFAAVAKNVDAGLSVTDATILSRRLTGDVSKSGRVFQADGVRLGVDAVDQGLLNLSNKSIGTVVEAIRESTPFTNPMIQGNRQLLSAMIEDPIGFNIRAWQNIGIPALAFFGWNELLGKEYNDYAMNERSGRDVVMNFYIGIPGKPPSEGIEIPLMHELLLYNSPFTRGLYGLARGENSSRTQAALGLVSENILSNSVDIGFPVFGQVTANIMGFAAPDSLIRPTEGVFKIQEDDIGLLPENLEFLTRTLFASIGDTAIHTANAVAGDPTFETFYSELRERTLDSTPIIKNFSGRKKSNTFFSIPNALAKQKFDNLSQFREYYDAYFDPESFNADGLEKPLKGNDFTRFGTKKAPVDNPLSNEDLPFAMIGPDKLGEPSNPYYKEFGPLIVESLFRGKEGATALSSRERTYGKFIKRLKSYNGGDADALQEWQALVSGITPTDPNTAELQTLLIDGNYDLAEYDDRIRLINEIEHRRADIINSQLDMIEKIEGQITSVLRERGELGPKELFDINKHLEPFDPTPLQ